MEAVRQAIDQNGKDIKPGEIIAFVKSKFGVTMSDGMASNYKSAILRKGARKRRKLAGAAKAPAPAGSSGISLADIEAVKELADRLGAEKLQQLAEVLTK